MRTNRLKATLKAGDIALGTIVWDARGRGVMHTLAEPGRRNGAWQRARLLSPAGEILKL
jgi:hypothetical protein